MEERRSWARAGPPRRLNPGGEIVLIRSRASAATDPPEGTGERAWEPSWAPQRGEKSPAFVHGAREGREAGPRLSGQAGLSGGKAATRTYPALLLRPSLCRKRVSGAVRRSAEWGSAAPSQYLDCLQDQIIMFLFLRLAWPPLRHGDGCPSCSWHLDTESSPRSRRKRP